MSSGPGESSGHGAWLQTGQGRFAVTFQVLLFEEDAPAPLSATIRANATLDSTGNGLTAPFRGEVMLPDGTVVQSLTGTAQGTRIMVEPL